MSATIVDCHPHIISNDPDSYPIAPIGGRQSEWSIERPATFEQLVAQMDEAGVERAVIVHSSTTYGYDNSYLADSVSKDPSRFAGVFSVDLRAADATETIDYWLSKPGLVGLRIFTAGSTLPGQAFQIDDPATYDAWAHLEERGIPICLGMKAQAIPEVRRMIDRFPNATIVLDHAAHPPLADGPPFAQAQSLFDLADYDRVYLKITPRCIEDAQKGLATPVAFMEALVKRFGATKLAWGSNYPNSKGSLASILQANQEALQTVSEKDRTQIFGKTALALYQFGAC